MRRALGLARAGCGACAIHRAQGPYAQCPPLCGLSLLLVLSLGPKGFCPGTPVFPCP